MRKYSWPEVVLADEGMIICGSFWEEGTKQQSKLRSALDGAAEADYPKLLFKKLCVTRLSSVSDAVAHVKVEWDKGSECRIEGSAPFRMSLNQNLVITDFSQLQDMQAGSTCERRVAAEKGLRSHREFVTLRRTRLCTFLAPCLR